MIEKILIKTVEHLPTSSGKDRWILNNNITVWSGGDAEFLSENIGKSLTMEIQEKEGWKTYKGMPVEPAPKAPIPQAPFQRTSFVDDNIRRQVALKEARAFISQLLSDKFIGTYDLAVCVGMIDTLTNQFELILNRQPPILREPEKK